MADNYSGNFMNGQSFSAQDLWGKTDPYESLIDHMKNVGDVAVRLVTNSLYSCVLPMLCEWSALSEEDVIPFVRYIASMHDIGKADPSFQVKGGRTLPPGYEATVINDFRHEKAVSEIAAGIWPKWDGQTRRSIAAVLSHHHQRKSGRGTVFSNDQWEALRRDVEAEIRKWAGFRDVSIKSFPDIDAFCTVLTGLIIISDWIASSGDIEAAFNALGLSPANSLRKFDFSERFGKSPRTMQQEVIDYFSKLKKMPLFIIIEAPPGEGKTELAVWVSHMLGEYWNKNGIYFGLPTAATSNQMVERMKAFFGKRVALLHGMSWLKEDTTGVDEEWKTPQKRGLLARYAVGTVDQVMMSVLKVRYGVLRLFGMMNKVVIIDEIHSYDAYMTEIISRLIEWCRVLKVPVVMLSATLPSERKKTLLGIDAADQGYPLTTAVFEDGTAVQFSASDVYRHMTAEISLIKGFKNVSIPDWGVGCILVNTIAQAQEIYGHISGPKLLIHSGFTAELRDELEKRVLECCGPGGSREHITIVATQVLEQSLDIDFDWLVSEIAPIDLLFQRLGRLHRFDLPGRGPAEFTVFIDSGIAGKEYGKSEYVYFDLLLKRTEKELASRKTLTIPDDIRGLIESVYAGMGDDNELESFLSYSTENRMLSVAARAAVISEPHPRSFGMQRDEDLQSDDETAARTRLGEGYKICILPKRLYEPIVACIAKEQRIPAKLASEAVRYSASSSKGYSGVSGTGKLAGYILRKGTAESPTDTSVSDDAEYKEKLIMDKEKGLCLM